MSERKSLKAPARFDGQGMIGVSPWVLSLVDELGTERNAPRWTYRLEPFAFELIEGRQSLWIVSRFPTGAEIALRAAYCPDGKLEIQEIRQIAAGVEIQISSKVGSFCTELSFPNADWPLLHCRTSLQPAAPLLIPFWPRDVIPLGPAGDLSASEGRVHTRQIGPRSGLVYFSQTRPRGGSALYFQNLTSLNEYCRQTETSLSDVVGGQWPELGFALPAASGKALSPQREVVISDAFMIFSPEVPADDLVMSKQFLDLLAQVYLALPRIETEYVHWPEIARRSLRDLSGSEKCWSEVRGHRYLNAYVGDRETPPESMVQLAVLLPLLEYANWSGEDIPITRDILANLPRFFDKRARVVARWLPSVQDRLDGSEPHKHPRVMDSWYLYHPLINLSRLALSGDEEAKKLFLDSLDVAIRVAHRFEYHWPVFYDLDTLEIIKAETKEGEGGPQDVAGIYAHVMLQAWELTGEDRYLDEARKAARSLRGLGFNLFYQANNVLFASKVMLRLWKITGDELYRDLSYLCMANALNNMWLWECDYGYAREYRTFFALFPLKDAPYTAVYEELEGFAGFQVYLENHGRDLPESLRILIAEFMRHLSYKASFYYPPNLPREALSTSPRTGEVDPRLWIPIEDMYEGWEQGGQVGQEVYGAGLPFALVARQYFRVPGEKFMIHINYPIANFSTVHDNQAMFRVLGDPRLSCRLRIMPTGRARLPAFDVTTERGPETESLKGRVTPEGHLEFDLAGERTVIIQWSTAGGRKGRKARKGTKK